MVRYCAVKGCNVKAKQGIMLFRFPKEPERRAKWIKMVNRVNWQPHANSTICELHFREDQWERKRIDGTRKLRCSAIPSLLPSKENSSSYISFVGKHNYCRLFSAPATICHRSQSPLKDITKEIQSSAASSSVIETIIKEEPVEESVEEPVEESVEKSVEESVKESDLKRRLELTEKELAALQTKHISMQKIASRVFKSYCNIKRQHAALKMKLRRTENFYRSSGSFAEKLREDQFKALCSKTTRGRQWSIQSITDGLTYKTKWGTQDYSNFVKKYPIFPSVRTLQKAAKHMKFNSVSDCTGLTQVELT